MSKENPPYPPFIKGANKEKLLLHVCCIGCGAYVMELLKNDCDIILYFYNPNIWPQEEYNKRLEETKRIAEKLGLALIVGEHEHDKWRELVKGHEADPERGERCLICYRARLEAAARVAAGINPTHPPFIKGANNEFDYFSSTLSISPHKDAEAINKIGNEAAAMRGIKFLDRDFKKDDGFRKSCQLSKELKLYRQNYCGCEFSVRK
jgi:predicted adenine nucleotide alpha hydrolase (AANH) superfamily ATPase